MVISTNFFFFGFLFVIGIEEPTMFFCFVVNLGNWFSMLVLIANWVKIKGDVAMTDDLVKPFMTNIFQDRI